MLAVMLIIGAVPIAALPASAAAPEVQYGVVAKEHNGEMGLFWKDNRFYEDCVNELIPGTDYLGQAIFSEEDGAPKLTLKNFKLKTKGKTEDEDYIRGFELSATIPKFILVLEGENTIGITSTTGERISRFIFLNKPAFC